LKIITYFGAATTFQHRLTLFLVLVLLSETVVIRTS